MTPIDWKRRNKANNNVIIFYCHVTTRWRHLLRPHGTASLDGEQLVVSSGDEELDRMALPLLDQILVLSTMQLTTQLIRACLQRGIPIAPD